MNEIDDIKRRAGITEADGDTQAALEHAHGMLHSLYMDIHQGKLSDDRGNMDYVRKVLKHITMRLEELNKFTGMNVPR